MKRLRILGLGIFLTAFTVFLAVFFLADFKLTDAVLADNLDEQRAELIRETSAYNNAKDQLIPNSFDLSERLSEIFTEANDQIQRRRGITPEMKEALLETPSDQYDSARVAFVIPIDRETVRKDLTASTNWIMERSYD